MVGVGATSPKFCMLIDNSKAGVFFGVTFTKFRLV